MEESRIWGEIRSARVFLLLSTEKRHFLKEGREQCPASQREGKKTTVPLLGLDISFSSSGKTARQESHRRKKTRGLTLYEKGGERSVKTSRNAIWASFIMQKRGGETATSCSAPNGEERLDQDLQAARRGKRGGRPLSGATKKGGIRLCFSRCQGSRQCPSLCIGKGGGDEFLLRASAKESAKEGRGLA